MPRANTKERLKTETFTEKENTLQTMVTFMKENSKKINMMVLEFFLLKMVRNMKEISLIMLLKEKVFILGLMEINIRVTSKMIKGKDSAFSILMTGGKLEEYGMEEN